MKKLIMMTVMLGVGVGFSSVTTHLALDTYAGTRTNVGTTELIRFSPAWETEVDGAEVAVSVNGVVMMGSTGAGLFAWTPTKDGTNTFTYAVSVNGVQVGETLSATFAVRFLTQTTDVPVPFEWLERFFPGTHDFESVAKGPAANGMNSVEEAYVAGIDPNDAMAVLNASVTLSNNVPCVEWTPNLNSETEQRLYRVFGRASLESGDWEYPANETHRFFKVRVSMPDGRSVSDVPGPLPKPFGGVQLWKDGPYWAECNVGASKPEENGYYFWWGDTVGYTYEGGTRVVEDFVFGCYANVTWVASDGTRMSSSPFEASTCPTYGKDNLALQALGFTDSTGNLVAAHDAATVHLGSPWRMPTAAEIEALLANCWTEPVTTNGVSGLLVAGYGDYASQRIFLPANGHGFESDISLLGVNGYWWSSSLNSDLVLEYNSVLRQYANYGRSLGFAIRPVRGCVK